MSVIDGLRHRIIAEALWPDDGMYAMRAATPTHIKGQDRINHARRREALTELHAVLFPKDD